MRITKGEYDSLGGMQSSKVYRKMVLGVWRYCKIVDHGE